MSSYGVISQSQQIAAGLIEWHGNGMQLRTASWEIS